MKRQSEFQNLYVGRLGNIMFNSLSSAQSCLEKGGGLATIEYVYEGLQLVNIRIHHSIGD